MISTYSDYIRRFILQPAGGSPPGEHHFVATYLLPRLFTIQRSTPDYVNPDGMKNQIGDIIYYTNGRPRLTIEVKFKTVHLTRFQYNNWIVNANNNHPDIFVGIASAGISILSWTTFRDTYLHITGIQHQQQIGNQNGLQLAINRIIDQENNGNFRYQEPIPNMRESENEFMLLLTRMIYRSSDA
jgi:hypothetical protein